MSGYDRDGGNVRAPYKWHLTHRDDGAIVGSYVPVAATVENRVAQAKSQGFSGDCCSNCGMFTMQQAGHCLVCASCGTTTGCS